MCFESLALINFFLILDNFFREIFFQVFEIWEEETKNVEIRNIRCTIFADIEIILFIYCLNEERKKFEKASNIIFSILNCLQTNA